jgi:hypothetical protein
MTKELHPNSYIADQDAVPVIFAEYGIQLRLMVH